MKKKYISIISLAIFLIALFVSGCNSPKTTETLKTVEPPKPANPSLILATTTSTQDSGLLDVLVPDFEENTGYQVKTIAVGTGAALKMGEQGEADVLLVHAPSSEKKLVDAQVGINYNLVMHNDFILVGPESDPAKVKDTQKVEDSFAAIAKSQSTFISRGDESGTNTKELSLWKSADIKPSGAWYQESGSGMGQTLNIASDKGGYTLTDRATFLANSKNLKLVILKEGDLGLLNIYHVMQVNPEKFPKVNGDGAKAFVDYLLDSETQKVIGDFGKDKFNQSLFFPDAGKSEADLSK